MKPAYLWAVAFLGIIVFLIIIIGLLFFVARNAELSPDIASVSALESCKSLLYSGENAINIVFFGEKNNVEKYKNYMLSVRPFNENKESFNFYYIDSYIPKCERYRDVALFCHSLELIKKAASCPNDFIFVLGRDENKIRSSSYENVMSINIMHPLSVMAHEFGHAFVSLDEEYVPAQISKNSPNCKEKCSSFESEDKCFEGCSKNDYYRSIDRGIMRTLSSNEYGKWNEKIILDKLPKSKILGGVTGNVVGITDCSKQQYYLIVGNYKNRRIEIKERSMERGCVGGNGAGGISYFLIDGEDNEIGAPGKFNPSLIYTDAPSIGGAELEINGEVFENEGKFTLTLPILRQAMYLSIKDDEYNLANIFLQDIGARACKIK